MVFANATALSHSAAIFRAFHATTIYRFSEDGIAWVGILLLGVALGAVWLVRGRMPDGAGRSALTVFAVCTTIIIPFSVASHIVGVQRCQWLYARGAYRQVTGSVRHFRAFRSTDHGREEFDVNDVSFSYGRRIDELGFRQTRSAGAPIRDGLPVRVAYAACEPFDSRYVILELDILEP
jgi:hypothetical protein